MNISTINIVYLVASAGTLALAAWGSAGYRKNPSPFIKYISLSTFFAGLYFFFNSVPFMLTSDLNVLKFAVNIGDIFYYSAVLTQALMIWYLGFYKKFSYLWFFIPTLVVSAAVYLIYAYNLWNTQVALKDGYLDYTWPSWGLRLDALLGALFIITGIYIMRLVKSAESLAGRLRIACISLAFLAGGVNAVYNTLFLHGLNNSGAIYIIYVVVFGLVFVVSILGRIQKTHSE